MARPRLRERTFHDYESLIRLYNRPVLGTRLIGAIGQMDMQGLYAQILEPSLSARTNLQNREEHLELRSALQHRMTVMPGRKFHPLQKSLLRYVTAVDTYFLQSDDNCLVEGPISFSVHI